MRFSHCVILRLTARYMPFVIQTNYNSPLHTSAVLITVNKRSYIVYKETDCLAAEILPHTIYNTNTYSDLPKVTNTTQGFGSFNNKIVWSWIVIDSLWIRPTDVLNSNFIGITTLHVSGSLPAHHQDLSTAQSALAYFTQVWRPLGCRVRMEQIPSWPCKQEVVKPA